MTENSQSKLNTALLVAVIVLLVWGLFWKPPSSGRFQRVNDNPRMALDTNTGQLCWTLDQPDKGKIPLCSELK